MIVNGHLAQAISDAAWGMFNHHLDHKVERSGKLFIRVDPRELARSVQHAVASRRKILINEFITVHVVTRTVVIMHLPS